MSRITPTSKPESKYASDELAGFEMLRWGIDSGVPPLSGPTLGSRENAQEGISRPMPAPLYRASMSAAGACCQTVSILKMQVRGQVLTRQAHEWVDQVLGWDHYDPETDSYPLLAGHTLVGVRVGLRIDAIEALRDGRLEDLTEDERQHVEFIRQVYTGSVTDASWQRQKRLIGSERGILEQATITLNLLSYVLGAHAFRIPPTSDTSREDVTAGLLQLKEHRRELGDLEAYEANIAARRWPSLESTFTKQHVHWFNRDVPGNLGIVEMPRSRVKSKVEEQQFGEDDLCALELLNAYDLLTGPSPLISNWRLLAGLSPMCALALEMWSVGGMKAQARGKISRAARAWSGLAVSIDSTTGPWYLLREYVPIALASGIRPDAIDALSEGDLDRLTWEERARVEFVRQLLGRKVTDESWSRQLELNDGSEDMLIEEIMSIFLQWSRVRRAQLLDLDIRTTKPELMQMLRDGTKVDIMALEGFFENIPWEVLSCYRALIERGHKPRSWSRLVGAAALGA